MKRFLLALLFTHFAFGSNFIPIITNDNYLERNYELLNGFHAHSQHIQNNPITDLIEKFSNNYLNNIQEDIYYHRYMSRLVLFFVNIISEYNNNDVSKILDILQSDNSDENVVNYAEELYLKYSNNLIKGAGIAFKKSVTIYDLNDLQFNNAKGIDVVYSNKNIINAHLINMIFFKILKSDPHGIIASESLGISLPVHIWFKLIIADQRTKMLIYKGHQKNMQIYDPKVIIEDSFKNDLLDNEKKLHQLLNNLFLFSYEDFMVIENSFKIIKNTEDLKNFNKKKHFFLFRYICYKNKNNKLSILMKSIFERIIMNDNRNYYNSLYKAEFISSLNSINFYDENKKNETIDSIVNRYSEDIFYLFKDSHYYDEHVSELLNKGYFDEAHSYGKTLKGAYNKTWLSFVSNSNNKLDLKGIIKLLNNYENVFIEQFDNIAKMLRENLNKEFLDNYDEVIKGLNYEPFKNVKIIDYECLFSSEFEKIRAYRYNIEIFKVLFLKLVRDKIIKNNHSVEEITAELKKYGNIKFNNQSINLFDKHDFYLNSIDGLSYKTRNKKLSGIDVFIFNKYLRETFLKIFFMSNNRGGIKNALINSDKLNIKLTFFEWCNLWQTVHKGASEQQKFIDNIFNQIVSSYKSIDSFIDYNNQHFFLDVYIIGNDKKSLREKLFRHYLYQSNNDLINALNLDSKNTELKEILRANFNLFLSKMKYDNKVLVSSDLPLFEQQDKDIIDEYFAEIIKQGQHSNFGVKKKKQKKQNTSKPKKIPLKKSVVKIPELIIKDPKSKNENKNQKKQNSKTSKSNQKKETADKPKQVTKELEKKDSLSEAINYLKYKLTGQRRNFLQQQKNNTQEILILPSITIAETNESSTEEIIKKTPKKRPIKKKVREFIDQCRVVKNAVVDVYNGQMPSIPLPSIFYSQNSFHRIFESHKSFLKDRAKTKEDYEKIAKEISRNFHYNILALDEFISQALNEPSFEKNQERNRLVYEAWCLMHQTLSSPLNQQVDISNLVQQVSNAFYALDEYYIDFFNFVEANSLYYNFAQQLLKVDGTMSEEDLANLLTWTAGEIKYKQFLSDKALNFPNLYGNIIKYSKELHKKISIY